LSSGFAVLILLGAGGCTYRGAIYASYQEAGLGIKATAESTAPIKVHFGYDRGVGAWVPRRGGTDEEATSLISRDDVRAGVNPTNISQSLLETDGVVISGTAAIVASSPANAIVKVVEGDAVTQGVATEHTMATGTALEVKTVGSAGNRVAAALSQAEVSDDQAEQARLLAEIRGRDDGTQIFRQAASALPSAFQTEFRRHLDAGRSVSAAFRRAVASFTSGAPDRIPEVITALRTALNAS
jgi:hypothetical protein